MVHIHNQRVALPMAYRVPEIHRIYVLSVRTAIRRYQANTDAALVAFADIHLIEKNHQLWSLDDLSRGTDPWNSQRLAMIRGIGMCLIFGEFLHLCHYLRLVRRRIRISRFFVA